jgi:ribosome production factor 2
MPRPTPERPSQPSPRVATKARKATKTTTKKVQPRVARALAKKAPKLEENPKTLLAMHGTTASLTVKALLTELVALRKPLSKRLGKANAVRPFEDSTSVEFLTQKNDASLFAFGSDSKKRPDCLVLGRTFDFHVLDMVEFMVSGVKLSAEFKTSYRLNSIPALIFAGAEFEHNPSLALVKNLLHDHFGPTGMNTVPAQLPAERVLVFTAHGDGVISMRHYAVSVGGYTADTIVMAAAQAAAGAGGKAAADGEGPRHVGLSEIGPRCELKLGRTRFADDELRKAALKRPKSSSAVPSKVKNVSHTALLGKVGRLRIERQDLHTAALKRVKALKKERPAAKPAAATAAPN